MKKPTFIPPQDAKSHQVALSAALQITSQIAKDYIENPFLHNKIPVRRDERFYGRLVRLLNTYFDKNHEEKNFGLVDYYVMYSITHVCMFRTLPTYDKDIICNPEKEVTPPLKRVKERFANVWFNDITAVSIINAYPTAFLQLSPHPDECSLSNFVEVFEFLMNFRKVLKETFHKELCYEIKMFVNMTYGLMNHKNSVLNFLFLERNSIVKRVRMTLYKIMQEFEGHWIYADIDTIMFRNFDEIECRFKEYIQNDVILKRYSFDIERNNSGMFITDTKYILKDSIGAMHFHGIKVL